MSNHGKINYVEFPTRDIVGTKKFFETVFNWKFTDYGPEYTSFEQENLNGGFYVSALNARTETGSALIVIYSEKLEESLSSVLAAGGTILRPIFSFPGGRRFQFTEPGGNELAVWGE